QRRIDVERVRGNAVGYAARFAFEEIAGSNLVVVVGGVGEGAAAIAIAERVDAGRAGAQCVVHLDEAGGVGLDSRRGKVQVVGVGGAADRQQHMRALDVRGAFITFQPHTDAGAMLLEVDAGGVHANVNALRVEDF